jgi:chaperone modulatory protein CbpM
MTMEKQIITGIIVDDNMTISFTEVCEKYHVPQETLLEMMDHGVFQQVTKALTQMHFDRKTLSRIQSIQRLQEDLGVNIAGAILALELLDELESVRNELRILRHHVY